MKLIFRFFFLLFLVIFISNCARTGRPEGGPKDEDAPLFVTSSPPYNTINFNKKEIKIEFDEYITLKDLNKQLVVSPPLKNPPLISPQGTPSKFIKIEILDTLVKNTTYIFNFGNAVRDNNESNILENFKYVFSTGNYIDSLTNSGSIKDAVSYKRPSKVNLLLYKIDSSYTDSLVYKKKPNYVTSALDTTKFNFTNLKEGKYFIIALEETTSDYLYNPTTDKIGFLLDTITLPKDSILKKPITLFKEKLPYSFKRGKEITKGKIQFGFSGENKDIAIKILSKTPENFKSISKLEVDKDTLNYWFTPFEADSLNFEVSNGKFLDTLTVKLRKKKIDSLLFNSSISGTLHFRDTLFILSNNPITAIDTSKVSIIDKDTIDIKYNTINSIKENKIGFIFDKKPKQQYRFKALPNAFNDLFSQTNDTIRYNLSTKDIDDYGKITLKVDNINSKNLIIEILTGKNQDQLIERKFINTSETLVFDFLEPNKYTIRAIVDENKNNQWDTGNFLKKLLPEKIIYYKIELQLRANHYLEENFSINDL
ncbi:Ig-like domain-containing protein [Polaribacter sp. MSW13]|uniref:Ig-like domain-containing protein n=1 Tax=Polaribacter marinus TaxID=2916838 RepID=A0A9X1VLP4_9FLAO|nr:Ig-like domain-containing protein [Polaribacter marinus]